MFVAARFRYSSDHKINEATLELPSLKSPKRENYNGKPRVQEPFNIYYFLGVVAVLLIPTLPATLTWIRVFNGYAGF